MLLRADIGAPIGDRTTAFDYPIKGTSFMQLMCYPPLFLDG